MGVGEPVAIEPRDVPDTGRDLQRFVELDWGVLRGVLVVVVEFGVRDRPQPEKEAGVDPGSLGERFDLRAPVRAGFESGYERTATPGFPTARTRSIGPIGKKPPSPAAPGRTRSTGRAPRRRGASLGDAVSQFLARLQPIDVLLYQIGDVEVIAVRRRAPVG